MKRGLTKKTEELIRNYNWRKNTINLYDNVIFNERGDVFASNRSALELRKQSILEQIKELELEHEMGTVSPSDFQRNRIELKDYQNKCIFIDINQSFFLV